MSPASSQHAFLLGLPSAKQERCSDLNLLYIFYIVLSTDFDIFFFIQFRHYRYRSVKLVARKAPYWIKKQKSSLLDYPFVDILNYPIHMRRAVSQTNYKSEGKSKFWSSSFYIITSVTASKFNHHANMPIFRRCCESLNSYRRLKSALTGKYIQNKCLIPRYIQYCNEWALQNDTFHFPCFLWLQLQHSKPLLLSSEICLVTAEIYQYHRKIQIYLNDHN